MRPTCPVCGGELTDAVTRCSSCPLHGGCSMVCCGNCGYETVAPRSTLVDLFKRLTRRRRNDNASSRVS